MSVVLMVSLAGLAMFGWGASEASASATRQDRSGEAAPTVATDDREFTPVDKTRVLHTRNQVHGAHTTPWGPAEARSV